MIYHKYDYHDNFLPHLSWYRIYHFRCFIINTEPRDHRCSNAVRAKKTWNRMKKSFLHEICITGKIEEVKQALDAHPDLVYASDDYVRYPQVNRC